MLEVRRGIAAFAMALLMGAPAVPQERPKLSQPGPYFAPGNLVVAVEGCGVQGGTCTSVPSGTGAGGGYGDNQAAPITLFQYSPNGTSSAAFVNSMALPQSASGSNLAVSGEYGSSSEGNLQLTGAGQYLTILGYGIDAPTFDAAYFTGFTGDPYGAAPSGALAQSGSLTGQSYTPIPRVLALIDANGNVNSTTAIFNIFNTNNPRSAYSADGTTAYVSGQGSGSNATGGVFYVPVGTPNTAPTAITGLDTSTNTIAQDTRMVHVFNNTLYVSVDTKEGSGSNRDFIGTLGTPPATSLYNNSAGPTQLSGFATSGAGKLTITSGPNSNGNNLNAGLKINLSPVSYFFASPSVLYVADGGNPKNDSNGDNNSTGKANIGNGGLQKWINSQSNGTGTWSLAYTLYQGLNIVNNGGTMGTTGLYGLAGMVSGNSVLLYATNYVIADLDQTYLYGITDTLSNTTPPGTSLAFTVLGTAPADSNFKGVSFAPSIPAGDVEITTVPSGLPVTSSGSGCAPGTYIAPQTLAWTPTSTCTLSVVTPQAGATGVQYALAQWEDGTTSASHTVAAPSTTATYTATFSTQYLLSTSAGAGGSVSAGGYFDAGSTATITATPTAGYYFVNFTGATTSTSNPLSLTMNVPATIVANFAAVASQTISFGPLNNQVMGAAPFTVSATASSGLPVSFAATTPAVCSVSASTVTLLDLGVCTIQATQPGNGMYTAAAPVNQSFEVTNQGLGVSSLLIGSAGGNASVVLTYAGAWTATANDTFLHVADASTNGTGNSVVVFSVDPFTGTGSRTGTLTAGGYTLTVTQAGTNYIGQAAFIGLASNLTSPAAIAVDTAGNVDFSSLSAGAILQWNFTTQQVTPLVPAGLNNPNGLAVDGSGNLFIADTNNNAIQEWIAANQQLNGLITSGLNHPYGVAIDSVGNLYIADSSNQAIEEWSAATQQLTTLVSGLSQPNAVAVDASGNVYFSDNGAKTVSEWNAATQQVTTLASQLNNPSAVGVDGSGNVYFSDSGTQAIDMWSPVTQQVTATVSQGLSSPVGIAVDSLGNLYFVDAGSATLNEVPNAYAGPASFTEGAAAGSDALAPVLPATAPLSGIFAPVSDQSWLTIGPVTSGVVGFSFTANTSTSARTAHITVLGLTISVTQSGLQSQTITFGTLPSQPYGTPPFAVSATASSGLPVSFASLTTAVCTVSGSTVTLVAVGACTIEASQAGNDSYAGAQPVDQTFQVTQASQTISFGPLQNQTYGAPPFTVSATASSGLPVSFASQTTPVCTVSGSTVTIVTGGLCTIQATQPGNATYAAATPVSRSFQVARAGQTITFGPLANQVYGAPPFNVSATASSGLPVSFTSLTTAVCTVSGSTVTLVAGGTCGIRASQGGNVDYLAATPITQSFVVTKATQTISFGPLSNQVYGAPPFGVSATASSGLAVNFASLTTAVCTVSGSTVTLVQAGTCTIRAAQPGNADYSAAVPVNQSLQVTKASQTITFGPLANKPLNTPPFPVSATASSGLPVSFASLTTSVCTVSGNTVTLVAQGNCSIRAGQPGNVDYTAAAPVIQTFRVTR